MKTVAVVALMLFAATASAETLTFHAVLTTIDQDAWLATSDPAYTAERREFYIKTSHCAHQSDSEPVVILVDAATDKGRIVFSAGDSCGVLTVALDRGSL